MAEIVWFIDMILISFFSLFTAAEFSIFLFIVLGFMTRRDGHGFSSFVRSLGLNESAYDSIEKFFKGAGFDLSLIRNKWYAILKKNAPAFLIAGRKVLLGDGTIQAHHGRHMPLVRKLASSNGTAEDVEYINGHYWGVVTLLAEAHKKIMSIPVFASIQQGFQDIAEWASPANTDHLIMGEELTDRDRSHVVQMVHCAFEAAKVLGRSLLVLDRYFLTVPFLQELKDLNEKYGSAEDYLLNVVTRCKINVAAYLQAPDKAEHQRGRPRKKGDKVKIAELFDDLSAFETMTMTIYGKKQKVQYCTDIFLWGKGLYMPMRFVLTITGTTKAIFVSTDTSMSAEEIITAYGVRFKIEIGFRTFKQVFSGFMSRFWTRSCPKYNEFKPKNEPSPISKVSSPEDHEKILNTIFAYECYTTLACIAMGIIQMIALKFPKHFARSRYLRTSRYEVPSEETVQDYLSRDLPRFLHFNECYRICRKIKAHQDPSLSMFYC